MVSKWQEICYGFTRRCMRCSVVLPAGGMAFYWCFYCCGRVLPCAAYSFTALASSSVLLRGHTASGGIQMVRAVVAVRYGMLHTAAKRTYAEAAMLAFAW
ncbi:hypothetical protein NPIL_325151 [Nephila pilipes]|uniref:Uncharacterized protein n=1 Tax=Nephila pilipes TaxID=299642 RepID=A0A8X6P1Y1_NEPPI|nr:hypothetical protein NPIL_325151 [Nephila pilipes]